MIQLFTENPILLVVAIVAMMYFFNNKVEKFTGAKRAIVTPEEYFTEIRVLNSYVGPYIGELYNYLRAKYFDPVKNISLGPRFKPGSVNDPTLSDPLLPIARAQIKAWIDSAKLRIRQKFGDAFLAENGPKADLFYTETPEKILKVVSVQNGEAMTFVI